MGIGRWVALTIDYLVPQYEALEKREGWAYLNLAIGANDIVGGFLEES